MWGVSSPSCVPESALLGAAQQVASCSAFAGVHAAKRPRRLHCSKTVCQASDKTVTLLDYGKLCLCNGQSIPFLQQVYQLGPCITF